MAKPNKQYWYDRAVEQLKRLDELGNNTIKDIESAINEAYRTIKLETEAWYGRFAKNNNITIAEAHKWLTASELKELKWDVEEYVKYGKENSINQKWMKELENASAKYHISRLESLELKIQQAVEKASNTENVKTTGLLKASYEDRYYRTIFDIQRSFNVGFSVAAVDENKLESILKRPWTADGTEFSERIWNNRTRLVNDLKEQLTQNLLTGKGPDELIKSFSSRFDTSKSNAARLVQTEQAAISSTALKTVLDDLDVEKYEIIATLDTKTSDICQTLDGKVFEMKYFRVGSTAPPFHPNCRTFVAPYFDDDLSIGTRAARDPETGKTIYVPGDIKYSEWKKEYVA